MKWYYWIPIWGCLRLSIDSFKDGGIKPPDWIIKAPGPNYDLFISYHCGCFIIGIGYTLKELFKII